MRPLVILLIRYTQSTTFRSNKYHRGHLDTCVFSCDIGWTDVVHWYCDTHTRIWRRICVISPREGIPISYMEYKIEMDQYGQWALSSSKLVKSVGAAYKAVVEVIRTRIDADQYVWLRRYVLWWLIRLLACNRICRLSTVVETARGQNNDNVEIESNQRFGFCHTGFSANGLLDIW